MSLGATVSVTICNRIIDLWGEVTPDGASYRQRSGVSADAVRTTLFNEFGAETVERALGDYLIEQGRREDAGSAIEPRDVFLTNCAFDLAGPAIESRLSIDIIAEIVCTLPSVGFYPLLRDWVKRYFDQATLMHLLANGVRNSASSTTRCSCLNGLQMYWSEATPSNEPALWESVRDFEAALRTQVESSDVMVADAVNGALKRLWHLHRRHPEWPRTAPGELRAYRHENGTVVTYSVERLSDQYVVLLISESALEQPTLVIRYKNQEPSLLPEDVPQCLNETLLAAHLEPGDAREVERVCYVDLVLKQTIEKPYLLPAKLTS